MSWQETINTVVVYPISLAIDLGKKMGNAVVHSTVSKSGPQGVVLPPELQNLQVSTLVHFGSPLIRIAAVSGLTACVLGVYGVGTLTEKGDFHERKSTYEKANRFHFYHSVAMIGASLSKHPVMVGTFLTTGTILFSGCSYYEALTERAPLKNLTSVGSVFLVLGWLLMIL